MEPYLPMTMAPATRLDAAVRDLADVDAAIELVSRGAVDRIRLVGLRDPDGAAALAAAHGLAADVVLALERDGRHATLVISRHA
jgi:hypothetical protein